MGPNKGGGKRNKIDASKVSSARGRFSKSAFPGNNKVRRSWGTCTVLRTCNNSSSPPSPPETPNSTGRHNRLTPERAGLVLFFLRVLFACSLAVRVERINSDARLCLIRKLNSVLSVSFCVKSPQYPPLPYRCLEIIPRHPPPLVPRTSTRPSPAQEESRRRTRRWCQAVRLCGERG